jgi:LysR family transcriptional regulator, regulator for genes of the gallate degradation pathway
MTAPAPRREASNGNVDLALPALLSSLRPLRAVLAVAQHGSTVRAAEALHRSQPAVARAILELERTCGLALFARATRGMAPTPAGARLAVRAEALFQQLALGASECVAAAPPASRRRPLSDRLPAVLVPAQLRALVAIDAGGSESRAAALLGVTQPAVHASLQSLQDLVGVRLLDKLPFGTRLTPAGEALLRRFKRALAEIRAMATDLATWRGEVSGRIVVGALPLSVGIFLPHAVDALLERYPDIEVQVVDGTYDALLRQLLSADIDVIAGALRAEVPHSEVRQVHLLDDELVVVARAGHPGLDRRRCSLRALLRYDWIRPLAGTPADHALEAVFRAQGLEPPQPGLRVGSPALTLSFVLQTGRLAIASRGQVRAENHGDALCIVPLSLPSTTRPIGIVMRAASEPAPHLQCFLDACQAAACSG